MKNIPVWRAARGTGRLATGGVRWIVDALVIAGPWLYLPAAAGFLAWWAGVPWWLGVLAAVALGAYAAADDGSGPSASRFAREGQYAVEEARARAKARQVRREWPRMCERAGWVTPQDLERRRPVPSLRFARTMGRRLIVAWRPPESVAPSEYPTHVEELRRVIGGHSADWRPVTADPGSVVALFGLQPLPDMVQGGAGALRAVGHPTPSLPFSLPDAGESGPVDGQNPDPSIGPGVSAVQQGPRFALGVGTGGAEVTWSPWDSPHMLVAGTTGGGKGSVTRTVVSQALAAGWDVSVVDGKDGGEYGWSEQHGARLSRQGPELAADRLGELEYLLTTDAARLYAEGVERWQDHSRADEWIQHLVVVDEAADLLVLRRGPEEKEADGHRAVFGARLNRLVAQGRAVGIHVVIALQRADASIVSGFMRNNCAARVAVGGLDPDGADMLFGTHGRDAALAYLDGTAGRAVAVGLSRGHTAPSPLQVRYIRAADLRVTA